MPKFHYKAIDQKGKEKVGKIDAATEEEAKGKVSGMGLIPTSVAEVKSTGGDAGGSGASATAVSTGGKKLPRGRVINQEDLTVFTRQLATLLQAGLPLLRSLQVLVRQERNEQFKLVVSNLADNVQTGNSLSDGLSQFPKIFDNLFVNMIKAGEAGGVLDVVLSRLALFMEKSVKVKKKVKSAMVYPAVVVGVAVIIVSLLMVFVVPKFQQIFQEMLKGEPLPALTQVIIDISNAIKAILVFQAVEGPLNWLVVAVVDIGIVVGAWFLFRYVMGLPAVDRVYGRVILKLPKIGDFVSKVAIARFTRTFGTLLQSGVPLLQAINITRDIIGNATIMEALTTVHDRVRDGESIAGPMERTKVFPTMVCSMIDVGEETGELPAMLNRIADNYDEDVDNAVAGITSIIEPIMIVFLAVVVGTIVIALFLPIIGIIQKLSG